MSEPTRNIPLSRGFVAIISESDYEALSSFTWKARYNTCTRSWYAVRSIRVNGKTQTIQMGRQILGLQNGDPRQADHENHVTLDNTRGNLRISTRSENCQNRRRRNDNTSGFKGVSWHRPNGKWRVQIWLNRANVLVGYFDSPEDAAKAYDARARQEFGEFALCNFPVPSSTNETEWIPLESYMPTTLAA